LPSAKVLAVLGFERAFEGEAAGVAEALAEAGAAAGAFGASVLTTAFSAAVFLAPLPCLILSFLACLAFCFF